MNKKEKEQNGLTDEVGYSIYDHDGQEIRWVPGHGNPDWDSGDD